MDITDSIISYRRHLKRRNYSAHTIKNYMNVLKHFVVWVDVGLEAVDHEKMLCYLDWLMGKRLTAKTINCHLACISGFYQYLHHEKGMKLKNPVKRGYTLRLPKPLPRYLQDEELNVFFRVVTSRRDRALCMLMLRCGLRVEEVAHLTRAAIDFKRRQIVVVNGKGGKCRVVYLSNDAYDALMAYLTARPVTKTPKLFLVEKGTCRGHPLSVRGAQVSERGLDGDRQRNLKFHGGPDRAVCLFSLELIEQLQEEGHPIDAGSSGENLTLSRLDWDLVRPGVRLSIGPDIQLEVTSYTTPCSHNRQWFRDEDFSRISQKLNPGWSRVYAKVLCGGVVRPGDAVTIEWEGDRE